MAGSDVKVSFLIVWVIISIIILVILVTPFVLPADTISVLVPDCEWKAKYNKECILCGMTTSFILISQGKFTQAIQSNGLSVWLYSILLLNEIFAGFFILTKLIQRKLNLTVNKTISNS